MMHSLPFSITFLTSILVNVWVTVYNNLVLKMGRVDKTKPVSINSIQGWIMDRKVASKASGHTAQ